MKLKRTLLKISLLSATLTLASHCSKKSDEEKSSDSAGTGGAGTGSPSDISESMFVAYPSQLAIAIFTDESASSLRLEADPTKDENAAFDAAAASASKPLRERAQEAEDRLKGDVDDCLPDALKRKLPPDKETVLCYQFDGDMLAGVMPERGEGQDLGTKNGLDAEGQPCLISFARSRVAAVNDLLERAQGLVSAALCQAKKIDANVVPPVSVGDTLDLTSALAAAFGDRPLEVVTAKMERKEDIDSLPVYKSTIEIKEELFTRTVVLVHSPDYAADIYNGTLYTVEMPESASLGLARPPKDSHAHVLSLNYAKVATDDGFLIQGQLLRARLAPELVSVALNDSGLLDLSAYRDYSAEEDSHDYGTAKKENGTYYSNNEDATHQTKIDFSVNPETDEGTVSYAQNPGSTYFEAARGMVAEVSVVDGVRKGCAIAGAAVGKKRLMDGYSIARAQKEGVKLELIGFLHPFFTTANQGEECSLTADGVAEGDEIYYERTCTSGDKAAKWYQPQLEGNAVAETFATDQAGPYVTRQCYKYVEADAAYAIDTEEVPDAAGYQVIKNDAAGQMVEPPPTDGVKPFEDGVAKED